MSMSQNVRAIPNGPGAAALVAAGIGCAAVGVLFLAEDASEAINKMLGFYKPVGALSGLTTVSIIVWLAAWFALNRMWATKTLDMAKVNWVSFGLLAVGFLLTFPPVVDLLQGK
jgi:hypothetical protein